MAYTVLLFPVPLNNWINSKGSYITQFVKHRINPLSEIQKLKKNEVVIFFPHGKHARKVKIGSIAGFFSNS